ncbi:MAG: phage holin family protein [Ruminococcus sp.]|nr:phage holin family protein [Ruminococcus sp.]
MNKFILAFGENYSTLKIYVTSAIAAAGGFVAKALGGIDPLLTTLVTLIILDYVTGFIRAIYKKELSSSKGFRGIIKKVFILLTVGLSVSLQNVVPQGIPLREITVLFFISNEGISILENTAGIIPLPKKLRSVLALIEEKSQELSENEAENSDIESSKQAEEQG